MVVIKAVKCISVIIIIFDKNVIIKYVVSYKLKEKIILYISLRYMQDLLKIHLTVL